MLGWYLIYGVINIDSAAPKVLPINILLKSCQMIIILLEYESNYCSSSDDLPKLNRMLQHKFRRYLRRVNHRPSCCFFCLFCAAATCNIIPSFTYLNALLYATIISKSNNNISPSSPHIILLFMVVSIQHCLTQRLLELHYHFDAFIYIV